MIRNTRDRVKAGLSEHGRERKDGMAARSAASRASGLGARRPGQQGAGALADRVDGIQDQRCEADDRAVHFGDPETGVGPSQRFGERARPERRQVPGEGGGVPPVAAVGLGAGGGCYDAERLDVIRRSDSGGRVHERRPSGGLGPDRPIHGGLARPRRRAPAPAQDRPSGGLGGGDGIGSVVHGEAWSGCVDRKRWRPSRFRPWRRPAMAGSRDPHRDGGATDPVVHGVRRDPAVETMAQ